MTSDVVEHILPAGEVSILAGSSGAGKSTLVMQLLKAFENGEETWLGKRLNFDARWGYLANDHAWKLYLDTAQRIRLNLDAIPHISLMDDETIDLEKFRTAPLVLLEDLLTKLVVREGCNVIVCDTLVSWFGGDIRNYNLPAYCLLRLGRWCRKHHATILGMHHATKARTDYTFKRAQDRISGSMSLLGFSSTQLCLLPPEETGDATAQFHVIAHNAPPLMIPLSRRDGAFVPFIPGEVILTPMEESVFHAIVVEGVGITVTRNALHAKLTHLSAASLDRHLKRLVTIGKVEKVRQGEYRIPPAVVEDPA